MRAVRPALPLLLAVGMTAAAVPAALAEPVPTRSTGDALVLPEDGWAPTSLTWSDESGTHVVTSADQPFRLSGSPAEATLVVGDGTTGQGEARFRVMAPEGTHLETGAPDHASERTRLEIDVSGTTCVDEDATVRHLSWSTLGQLTSLDVEGSCMGVSGRARYRAPSRAPLMISTTAPQSGEGQLVTLTTEGGAPGERVLYRADGRYLGFSRVDARGISRLTTSALTRGTHTVTGTADSGASASVDQRVRGGSTVLLLESTAQSTPGAGRISNLVPSATQQVQLTTTDAGTSVRVGAEGAAQGSDHVLSLSPRTGAELRPGTSWYTSRTPSATRAGLDYTSAGRACTESGGVMRVGRVTRDSAGRVSSFEGFVGHECEGRPVALTGGWVRYNVSSGWSTTQLATDRLADGRLKVEAHVATASGRGSGSVDFYRGTTKVGSATVGSWGKAVWTGEIGRGERVRAIYTGSTGARASMGAAVAP